MSNLTIRSKYSVATMTRLGAFVKTLTLDGNRVIKRSRDEDQTHGGIAVLAPYADKVEKGEYTFEGNDYQLPLDEEGDAIHGFAKDTMWDVKRQRESSVALTADLRGEGYPGKLRAEVTYAITSVGFATDCTITNVGEVNCPVVVGFHPYFLGTNWRLTSRSDAFRYLVRDRYFPTGEREAFPLGRLEAGAALDDSFAVPGPVAFQNESYRIVMRRRAMPYLVVYNGEFAEGTSVAVEPYTGLTDAYNNGIGLRNLRPGRSLRCGYDIALSLRRASPQLK